MKFIADFHIHSKYSRATSKEMDLENLDKWARIKGIDVLGTGDFTHPAWFKELKSKLEPAEPGLFQLKKQHQPKADRDWNIKSDGMKYILTTEISCIYSKKNKTRKAHIMIFAPSFEVVEKINAHLGWIGNLKADGRPILGLDAKELVKIVLNISPEALVIPAHAWTPHFSVFGSGSGFNSLKECFDEYTRYIYAIETGLSSDPAMNWRWSDLDGLSLISNSDSHSPRKIGREANIFEGKIMGFRQIAEALRLGVRAPKNIANRLAETIEFFPEEGKYHYDGHRNCKIVFDPAETKKHKGLCPVCGRPLIIGVMNRVEKLANRPVGSQPTGAVPFRRMIPLEEIIGEAMDLGVGTKGVEKEYRDLINKFGSEFKILLEADCDAITKVANHQIGEALKRVRAGQVKIEPGYDGEYGKIKIFDGGERANFSKQVSLF
ncbi:MAG: and RNA helicase protein [Parcubacteria group bacterium GW2011_GWC2_42_6]|nr:MAG: and RNA helicase protein [Parcubacteria group bacterium GW2011_GWA2_42_11]KKS66477.1 MAG: and RNA helicase protein [Parcubacteria group bacterium GW2011_GWC2_42_6]